MKTKSKYKFSLENENFYLVIQILIWIANTLLFVGFLTILKIN